MINASLYDNGSGGRLYADKGGPILTNSVYTEVYLCFFGGNKKKKWWGNNPARTERWVQSETESVLKGATITSELLAKVESAMKSDLKPLEKYGTPAISVTVTGRNRIELYVYFEGSGQEVKFEWASTINEIIVKEEI